MYEEAEENEFDKSKVDTTNDGENFGWALADTW